MQRSDPALDAFCLTCGQPGLHVHEWTGGGGGDGARKKDNGATMVVRTSEQPFTVAVERLAAMTDDEVLDWYRAWSEAVHGAPFMEPAEALLREFVAWLRGPDEDKTLNAQGRAERAMLRLFREEVARHHHKKETG